MAELKTMENKFALRTLPLIDNFFYGQSGLNFPIFVKSVTSNKVVFVELRKNIISKDIILGENDFDFIKPADFSELEASDDNWITLADFIEESRPVFLRIANLSKKADNFDRFSLYENEDIALCIKIDTTNRNNFTLFFQNKNLKDAEYIAYLEPMKDRTKKYFGENEIQKYYQMNKRFGTKEGIMSCLRSSLKTAFSELSNSTVKNGLTKNEVVGKINSQIDTNESES